MFLQKRDTFVWLPTDNGKSLNFQLAVCVAAELTLLLSQATSFSCVSIEFPQKKQVLLCERLQIRAIMIESDLSSLEGIERIT